MKKLTCLRSHFSQGCRVGISWSVNCVGDWGLVAVSTISPCLPSFASSSLIQRDDPTRRLCLLLPFLSSCSSKDHHFGLSCKGTIQRDACVYCFLSCLAALQRIATLDSLAKTPCSTCKTFSRIFSPLSCLSRKVSQICFSDSIFSVSPNGELPDAPYIPIHF